MRSYLAVAVLLAALGWQREACADQAPGGGSTWVGPDGRTYYVPAAAHEPEQEEAPPDRGRKRRKPKGPPKSVGMAVAGGILVGLGGIAFTGGLAGYFGTIDCQSAGFMQVSCRDHKEILLVSLVGIVSATAVGTPLLVVGLRRTPKNEIESPAAEDASLSVNVGPVSGLTLRF